MKEKVVNGLIFFLCAMIIVIVFIKFGVPMIRRSDRIDVNFSKINLLTIENKSVSYEELNNEKKDYCVFFFSLKDCMTCVMKGLLDVENMQKNGDDVLLIIIHNDVNEMKSWLGTYANGNEAYMISSEQAYKYIRSPYLPIMVTVDGGKIENYRYITN